MSPRIPYHLGTAIIQYNRQLLEFISSIEVIPTKMQRSLPEITNKSIPFAINHQPEEEKELDRTDDMDLSKLCWLLKKVDIIGKGKCTVPRKYVLPTPCSCGNRLHS